MKIVNAYFTILVRLTNLKVQFYKKQYGYFQAIGIGYDLTINGQRKNVKILRRLNDKLKVSSVDLTSSDFYIT